MTSDVVADVADEVVVMYGGTVMEQADRSTDVFTANHHPYTEGLLASLPAYGGERQRLRPIPGQPPSPIMLRIRLSVRSPVRLRDGPVPHRDPAARAGWKRPGPHVGLLAAT